MAKIHGVAGEWARVQGTVTGLWPLFIGVFLLGFSFALAVFVSFGWGAIFVVLSMIEICLTLAYGLRRVERYFKGARGEERVAGILRRLPSDYHVFNDYVVGRCHVDHVVVGPPGVFAVETKNWTGKVTVEEGRILIDGILPSRPPLAQVVREAELVRTSLAAKGWTGTVTPVLAFSSDNFLAHIAEVGSAVIVNANELEERFNSGREILAPSERTRLVGLME